MDILDEGYRLQASECNMSLDDYHKSDGTPISDLEEYNLYLAQKRKEQEAKQKKEAQDIASQMTEDVLMDIKN